MTRCAAGANAKRETVFHPQVLYMFECMLLSAFKISVCFISLPYILLWTTEDARYTFVGSSHCVHHRDLPLIPFSIDADGKIGSEFKLYADVLLVGFLW